MKHQRIVEGTVVLALAFSLTTRALAHGGEPRIEINADRLNPGGTLDVRGVDFSPESEVFEISLADYQSARLIFYGQIIVIVFVTDLPVTLYESTPIVIAVPAGKGRPGRG